MTDKQKALKAEFAKAIALEKGIVVPDGWEVIDYDIPKQGESYAMAEREKADMESLKREISRDERRWRYDNHT